MSYTCFAETALQLAKDEDKLFESLLKIDFRKAQILKEADLDAQTDPDDGEDVAKMDYSEGEEQTKEVVKKKIFEKIAERAQKILDWLKAALGKVAEKFKEFFYKDSKIVKVYGNALANKDNLKGFAGIPNFAAANLTAKLPLSEMADISDDLREGKFTEDAQWADKCDNLIDLSKKALDAPVEEWNKDGSANYDFAAAIKILATNQLTKDVFTVYKKLADSGKVQDKLLAKLEKDESQSATKDEAQQYIGKIKLAADAGKAFVDTYVKYFKALRQAMIVCGTYALKKAKGADQATAESVTWLAGLSSAQYLDESFAFI